jgi:DNA-binding XRE family transcriptional regulator
MRLTAPSSPHTVYRMYEPRTRRQLINLSRSHIGGFILRRRRELGLTRQDLVNLSKVSKRALAALESGEAVDPRSSTVISLAFALKTSADELLGLAG